MKVWISIVAALLMCVTLSVAEASRIEETFNDDPVANDRATVVGTNKSLMVSTAGGSPEIVLVEPFQVLEQGVLTHHLTSNWRLDDDFKPITSSWIEDGSRLHIPLGATYTDKDSFSFGATLRVKKDRFSRNTGFQINFGLVNCTDTGMDRTGNTYFGNPVHLDDPSEGTTYNSIEWDYFPDNSSGGYPTCQQVVFGKQGSATSAFTHMAANFGSLLSQDPYEYGLPFDVWMDVVVDYDAVLRKMTVTVKNETGDDLVGDAVPELVLAETWFDGDALAFSVDTLAIMNYQDYWASGSMSLLATVEYDNLWFEASDEAPVPEASAGAALCIGLAGLLVRRRRRG